MKTKNISYLFYSYFISKKFKEPENSEILFDVLKTVLNKRISCTPQDDEDTFITALTEFEAYGIEGFYFYLVKNITEREKTLVRDGVIVKEKEITDEDKYNFIFVVPSLSLIAVQDSSANYKIPGKSSVSKIAKIIDTTEYSLKFEIKEPFYDIGNVFNNLQSIEYIIFEVVPFSMNENIECDNLQPLLALNKAKLTGKLLPIDTETGKFSDVDQGIINELQNFEKKEYAKIGFKGITDKGTLVNVAKQSDSSKTRQVKVYVKEFPEIEEHVLELARIISILFEKKSNL